MVSREQPRAVRQTELEEDRVVDLREVKFGIEIETVKRERGTVAKAIQSVVGGEVTHVERPPATTLGDQRPTRQGVESGSRFFAYQRRFPS